jgi:UDP:flavonoid glycosyltransferase YjiC (YdhE family)
MARILLTTLGSLGDLHPLLAIGLELQQRGHVVRFCASETYRAKIQGLGFGFDPLRPDATPENVSMAHLVKEIMDPRKGTERLLCDLVLPHLEATYTDLFQAVTGPPAIDLVVSGELVYAAPIIAEKLGIRWASYITAPMSFFSAHDPPVLPPFPKFSQFLRALGPGANRAAIRLIKLVTRKWSEPIRQLRARLGLSPGKDPIYEGKFSPQLVLAIFSSVLASPQPDWPPNTIITGFPFYDGPTGEHTLPPQLAAFLEAGEMPIVFTLGSSAVLDPGRFYIESADAARQLKRRAVLLLGRNPPPTPLPEGIIPLGYIGFSKLFPRAAAVVHQGGVGTTGQALRAGCPTLVMPYNFDQPDNAARLVRLGVGRVISRRSYTAQRAAAELKTLLHESSYRRNAVEIGHRMQKELGAVVASEALERLLR